MTMTIFARSPSLFMHVPTVSVLPTNPKNFNVDNVRVAKILVRNIYHCNTNRERERDFI